MAITLSPLTTFSQGRTAVASAGTPVQVVSTPTHVRKVEFFARKANGTANTGVIYLGLSSVAASNYRVVAVDGTWIVEALAGTFLDLSQFYIDAANAADAVAYTTYS